MTTKLPTIGERRLVCQSRLFSIESVDLTFSNGEERQFERFLYSGRSSVVVIPITSDNNMLMVREYAVGAERYELGFVKGIVEKDEDILVAANREMKEEVGFGAKTLTHIRDFMHSPGYSRSVASWVVAHDLYEETLPGDEPEPLEVVSWPIDDIEHLLLQEDFTDARSVACVLLLERFLKGEKSVK